MTDKEKPEEADNDQELESPEELDSEVDKAKTDLEVARAEAADYLDRLQRLKAEFENFRKRMIREQGEVLKFASQGVIVGLLPIIDNFERALDHEIQGEQLDEFKKGLKLVYAQLFEVLSKEGLSILEPVGQVFDPARHEAIMQEDSDEHAEGTVVRVVEKGYVLQDRIIRHAKVTVAK